MSSFAAFPECGDPPMGTPSFDRRWRPVSVPPAWFHLGRLGVTATALVSALLWASTLIASVAAHAVADLALEPASITDPGWWRLWTWPLAATPSLWNVVALGALWVLGHELERRAGPLRFLGFVAFEVLATGLVARTVGVHLAGAAALHVALGVAIVVDGRPARVRSGLSISTIAAALGAAILLGAAARRDADTLCAAATAGTLALLQLRAVPLRTITPPAPPPLNSLFTPRRPRSDRSAPPPPPPPWTPPESPGQRPHVRPTGPTEPSRGWFWRPGDSGTGDSPAAASPALPAPEPRTRAVPADLDALLDKVARDGLEGLDPGERARLDQISRELRE